jgi:superfamily II DNA helicase RecQ
VARFSGTPRMALTATADEPTRAEILSHLAIDGARTRAVRNRTLRANRLRTYATRRSPAGIRSDRNPFGI